MNPAKLFVYALCLVLPATVFAEQAPSGPVNHGFAAFAYYFGGVAKASEGDLTEQSLNSITSSSSIPKMKLPITTGHYSRQTRATST